MKSYIQSMPLAKRADAIKEVGKQQKEGTLVVLKPYRDAVVRREANSFYNGITMAVVGTVGTAAGVYMLTNAALLAGVGMAVAGASSGLWLKGKREEFIDDIEYDEWSGYLTDHELRELAFVVKDMAEPTTVEAKASLQLAYKFLAEEIEATQLQSMLKPTEAVTVEAVEVKDDQADEAKASTEGQQPGPVVAKRGLGAAMAQIKLAKDGQPAASPDVGGNGAAPVGIGVGTMLTPIPDGSTVNFMGTPTQPDVAVIQRIDDQTETAPVDIDFLFANGGINPEFLQIPLKERAEFMLKALAQCGCNLRSYLKRPILGTTGLQRSGKSTVNMVLMILKMAIYPDKKYYYVTGDDDVYPVAFDGLYGGSPEGGAVGYAIFTELILNAGKNELKDQCWFLDEVTKTLRSMDAGKKDKPHSTAFYNGLGTGYHKTKCQAHLVFHGTTSTAMGVPDGYAEQAKGEVSMLKADRISTENGDDYPSGKYRTMEVVGVQYQPADETCIELPDWLLFAQNPSIEDDAYAGGHPPCYVHSLLEFFPELDTRKRANNAEFVNLPASTMGMNGGDIRDALNEMLTQELSEHAAEIHAAEERQLEPIMPTDGLLDSDRMVPGGKRTYKEVVLRIEKVIGDHPDALFTYSGLLKKMYSNDDRDGVLEVLPQIIEAMIENGSPLVITADQKVGMEPLPVSGENNGENNGENF